MARKRDEYIEIYTFKRALREAPFILLGVLSAAFGLKGFLLPSHFFDGGVTGISLIVTTVFGTPLSLLLVVFNLPFVFLGFKSVGKVFGIKTVLAIAALSIAVALIDFPTVTKDKLLIAIFGGIFLGGGIGFAIRGGAVIDGTEVLALYISRKTGLTVGDILMLTNLIIFSVAAAVSGVEIALYAILTYIAVTRTVDFIVQGVEEYVGIHIVSLKSDEIKKALIYQQGRGVTIYKGQRGYGKHGEGYEEIDVLFTLVTILDVNRIKNMIERLDPHAFIYTVPVKDTHGGIVKARPLH